MWIKVDASVRDHRKVWKAADMTGEQIPTIIGCMVSLWTWCATNAPDGVLDDIPAATVARAAQWSGDAAEFEKTLILCGFLDVDGENGSRSIHNWMDDDRTGGSLEKISEQREKANERKRKQRAAQRAAKAAEAENADDVNNDQSRGCHADVTRDITRMSRDRKEKIRQDKIREDKYIRGEAASISDQRADDNVNDNDNVTRTDVNSNDNDGVTRTKRARRKKSGDDEPDPSFDAFWSLYPKKVGKINAVKAWKKIRHTEEVDDQIMRGVRNYVQCIHDRNLDTQYILNPATLLNQERWNDYIDYTTPVKKAVTRTNGPHDNVYDFDQIEAAAEAEGRSAAIETRRDVDYTEGFGDYKSTDLWKFLTAGGDDTETDKQTAQ